MNAPKDIKTLYEKYGVAATKRFGQNFLIDQNILNKIVERADIVNKDVIEIGPGLGSLTKRLLEVAKSVTAYELDQNMIRVLEGEIHDSKFQLVAGDFLKTELSWVGKKDVVANIPYNITSDILFKLFANIHLFNTATLMLQKEVAERLLAPVGSSDYGKLTISTQIFAHVEKVIVVPPQAFMPAPKVNSMVVKLTFNQVDFEEQRSLLEFIKNCFGQRRKTLLNNLKNMFSPDKAKTLLDSLSLKETIRPQELTKDQFITLFKNSIM